MTWIKICGITSSQDAEAAIQAGASALGLVFAPSPREVSIEQAREIAALARGRIEVVGVFKDVALVEAAHAALRFDRVQIHGPALLDISVPVIRAIRPDQRGQNPREGGEITLIDGSEGRGESFDWSSVPPHHAPFVIAGGLTPENVGEAIAIARPHGVDVSSGVESAPGRKDPGKMARFVAAVRKADARN